MLQSSDFVISTPVQVLRLLNVFSDDDIDSAAEALNDVSLNKLHMCTCVCIRVNIHTNTHETYIRVCVFSDSHFRQCYICLFLAMLSNRDLNWEGYFGKERNTQVVKTSHNFGVVQLQMPIKKLYMLIEMAAQGEHGGEAEAIYSGRENIAISHFFDCLQDMIRY